MSSIQRVGRHRGNCGGRHTFMLLTTGDATPRTEDSVNRPQTQYTAMEDQTDAQNDTYAPAPVSNVERGYKCLMFDTDPALSYAFLSDGTAVRVDRIVHFDRTGWIVRGTDENGHPVSFDPEQQSDIKWTYSSNAPVVIEQTLSALRDAHSGLQTLRTALHDPVLKQRAREVDKAIKAVSKHHKNVRSR